MGKMSSTTQKIIGGNWHRVANWKKFPIKDSKENYSLTLNLEGT